MVTALGLREPGMGSGVQGAEVVDSVAVHIATSIRERVVPLRRHEPGSRRFGL